MITLLRALLVLCAVLAAHAAFVCPVVPTGSRRSFLLGSMERALGRRLSTSGGGSDSKPVLVWDVMSTLVYDPFFVEVPRYLQMESLNQLYKEKDSEAWEAFEKGQISEEKLLRNFFLDRRPFDGKGMVTMLNQRYEWLPGVEKVLSSLKQQGYDMHVLSNYPMWFKNIEAKLKLSRYMQWSFVSCETGVRKPDTRSYTNVCERLNVEPRDLVFVDDSATNVRAASELGWRSVLFTSADKLVEDFAACGIHV